MFSAFSYKPLSLTSSSNRFTSQAALPFPIVPKQNKRFDPNEQAESLDETLTALKVLLTTASDTTNSESLIRQVLLKAACFLTERSGALLAKLQKTLQLDSLTQVSNRAAFDDCLEKSIIKAKADKTPLTIAMIDLDHFKAVNDTYGHPVGDIILKKLSEVARNTLRGQGEFFRYGGEEFAFILTNSSQAEAEALLDALRDNLSKCNRSSDPVELKKVFEERSVTLSAGMVYQTFTDEQANTSIHPKDLLEKADKALYQAKQEGRNRICVYKEK